MHTVKKLRKRRNVPYCNVSNQTVPYTADKEFVIRTPYGNKDTKYEKYSQEFAAH